MTTPTTTYGITHNTAEVEEKNKLGISRARYSNRIRQYLDLYDPGELHELVVNAAKYGDDQAGRFIYGISTAGTRALVEAYETMAEAEQEAIKLAVKTECGTPPVRNPIHAAESIEEEEPALTELTEKGASKQYFDMVERLERLRVHVPNKFPQAEQAAVEDILEEALRITKGDRNNSYGAPTQDFDRTAKMWSAILGIEVSPTKMALCMIALKISRACWSNSRDHWVDIAGYARCGYECAKEEGGA
jgi:hypothetical protein